MVTADYYYPACESLVDFFCNLGLKNCWHGQPGIEPTTLDLSSQSGRAGTYDLSATATPQLQMGEHFDSEHPKNDF